MSMQEAENYTTSEEFDGDEVSNDHHAPQGFAPILPGRYISRGREIQREDGAVLVAKTARSGNAYKQVTLKHGSATTEKGEEIRAFLPFDRITTTQYEKFGESGKASDVGRFLKACRLSTKTSELEESLVASQSVVVGVKVTWEEKYDAGKPEGYKYKKAAFFKDASGKYVHEKVDSETGEVIKARAKISGYFEVK